MAQDAGDIARLMTGPRRTQAGRLDQAQGFVRRALEKPDVLSIWVAEGPGGIDGYARAVYFEPPDGSPDNCVPAGWYLLGINVDPGARGRGLGTLLTDVRMQWFRERGAQSALYFQRRNNLQSKALHRRYGFRVISYDFSFPGMQRTGHLVLLQAALA